MQEEYHAEGKKMYMCFVVLDKTFDRVPRKVDNEKERSTGSFG